MTEEQHTVFQAEGCHEIAIRGLESAAPRNYDAYCRIAERQCFDSQVLPFERLQTAGHENVWKIFAHVVRLGVGRGME